MVVAPPGRPPFPVEARVLEEDTFLVLSARPTVVEPLEDPLRLMTRLIETRPETPGTVLVRGRGPYRLLAVVHDLNQEPTWRESWAARALEEVFDRAEACGWRALCLEMLGCVHGRLDPGRFAALLRAAVLGRPSCKVRRVWLLPARRWTPEATARLLRTCNG